MKLKIYGLAFFLTLSGVVHAEILKWEIKPSSLVTHDVPPLQNVSMEILASEMHNQSHLKVWVGDQLLVEKELGRLVAGSNRVEVLMPEPENTMQTRWELINGSEVVAENSVTWKPPRHWQLYVIKSSHIDIGLHDSQFKQRYMANEHIDNAVKLAEKNSSWPEPSRFRYVIEGLWWWLNYVQDRPEEKSDQIVERYCQSGDFGIGASHSGNRTEVFSSEELCRSLYCVQQARERWNLPMDTMMMVDNNGLTWPLVTAYADAGIRYAGLFSNAWNPGITKPVLGWGKDATRDHFGAGGVGGGSRIDVGWDSELPHLFYWQGADKKSRILVWTSPTYTSAGYEFGLSDSVESIAEKKMARQFAKLEQRYPYDIWLIPFYKDDESPNLTLPAFAKQWNARWRWPEIRTVGDLSVPFRAVEKRFGDQIPVLSGMITAGWAQHPVSTPSILAAKREVDRLLPVAEKLATVARLTDPGFVYPTLAFRRAWDGLICNDEHGYGVSTYTGRKVFDTWMQKKDWIVRSYHTAATESARALKSLAAQVTSDGLAVLVFNPTLQSRSGIVEVDIPKSAAGLGRIRTPEGNIISGVTHDGKLQFVTSQIPSMGYARFDLLKGDGGNITKLPSREPPILENNFYRVMFGADGAITAIYDKELKCDLIDAKAAYRCNQLVYSADNNLTFTTPSNAQFEVEQSALETTVIATLHDAATRAEIVQRVSLPTHEKRIDIDNRLNHVMDLADGKRYNSFGYYAFPFNVPQGEFRIGLNGCSADALKDQTGHGTDTYHAARDWSYVGNGKFGVALVQLDSMLIECGRIHKQKNVIGDLPGSSHLYSYIFNDWLFSHASVTGPSYINLRYRYVIVSHAGNFAESGVEQLAERVCTPLLATVIPRAQKGTLPSAACSFLSVDVPHVALLALKLSEKPGAGVIARFHENDGVAVDRLNVTIGWGRDLRLTRCSVIEQDRNTIKEPVIDLPSFGYATLRIEEQGGLPSASSVNLVKVADESVTRDAGDSPPAKVGSHYTGLISDPRAWRGVEPDLLYLQWGQNQESGLSHYELYRGDTPDFDVCDQTYVAKVEPGPYLTVPYEDRGLKPHTTYFYRVLAVDKDGLKSEPSELCTGITHELFKPVTAAKPPIQPGLSVVAGSLMLQGNPYRGMGVNYFSLFYRTLKDNTDLSYQEGLKSLSEAGIPFVRFMACGFWPSEWDLYLNDKEGYFKQLDGVVRCAEKNKIGLIPSLFWNMATVPDMVGEPLDQLGNPDSKTMEFIRQYTSEVVQRYKDSSAIWGWEFGNEYNLHADLPNASKHRPPVWTKLKTASSRSERDEITAQMMLTAYGEFARVVRSYDAHRILITGNSIPRPNAWHNSKEKSWAMDSLAQFAEILQRDNPDPFSMLSVHIYPRDNNEYPGGFTSLSELIDGVQKIATDSKKPLFIGEFGASLKLGEKEEQQKFSELISAIEASRVPLSALWVFDHSGQDKDWNITFENKRAYMLKAVSQANQRIHH